MGAAPAQCAGARLSPEAMTTEKPWIGDGRDVDPHADRGQEPVGARADGAGADLLAGEALFLEDDDAIPPVRGRGRKE